METHKLIATILAFVALVDLGLMPVVAARVPREKRGVIKLSLFASSVMMVAMAIAFYMEFIPVG